MNPHWRTNYPDGCQPGDEEPPEEQEENFYDDSDEPREKED